MLAGETLHKNLTNESGEAFVKSLSAGHAGNGHS
jgi:hypothetical protein